MPAHFLSPFIYLFVCIGILQSSNTHTNRLREFGRPEGPGVQLPPVPAYIST